MAPSSSTLNAVQDRADQQPVPSPTQSPPSKHEHSIRHPYNHTHHLSPTTRIPSTIVTHETPYTRSSYISSHTVMTIPDTQQHSHSHTSSHKYKQTSIELATSRSSLNWGESIQNVVSLSSTTPLTRHHLPSSAPHGAMITTAHTHAPSKHTHKHSSSQNTMMTPPTTTTAMTTPPAHTTQDKTLNSDVIRHMTPISSVYHTLSLRISPQRQHTPSEKRMQD